MWGPEGEVRMILSKVKVEYQNRSASSISIMVAHLPDLKKEIFRGVFRTLWNAYDEVFVAEVVNVFQLFTIFAKKTLRYSSLT